ncbi:MAG TPA: winged helix DNA-binding domain-containing protein [Chloroflexota bacterium]
MAARRRISTDERRARLGKRQLLAHGASADDPVAVAHAVVALHATDAATVFLSAAARMRTPDIKAIEAALYEERTLIRMLGMRRTMFVVPVALMPVVHAACTTAIAAVERKRTIQLLEGAGITMDGARWLEEVERATLAELEARSEALASELTRAVPKLEERIRVAEGKNYAGYLGMSTRVLFLMSADGRVVRGRPRGSWISSQHRWAPIDTWLREPPAEWSVAAGQAELVRRWLASFGPGTRNDLRWWTGLTAREINAALEAIGALEVDLEDGLGVVLPDDEASPKAGQPWVALLPGLDPTPMGWKDRAWFLGAHGPTLFDRSGNIGPSIWLDGRIIGGWSQRPSGEVVVQLLEDVGGEAKRAVDNAAHTLGEWIGPIRITPRFRTPLERELSG